MTVLTREQRVQAADEKLWKLVQEARSSGDPRWQERVALTVYQPFRAAHVQTKGDLAGVCHTLVEEAFGKLGQWDRAFDDDMDTLDDLVSMAESAFEQLDPPAIIKWFQGAREASPFERAGRHRATVEDGLQGAADPRRQVAPPVEHPRLGALYLTSDGFLLAEHRGEIGANDIVCVFGEFEDNLLRLYDAAELTREERIEMQNRLLSRVFRA